MDNNQRWLCDCHEVTNQIVYSRVVTAQGPWPLEPCELWTFLYEVFFTGKHQQGKYLSHFQIRTCILPLTLTRNWKQIWNDSSAKYKNTFVNTNIRVHFGFCLFIFINGKHNNKIFCLCLFLLILLSSSGTSKAIRRSWVSFPPGLNNWPDCSTACIAHFLAQIPAHLGFRLWLTVILLPLTGSVVYSHKADWSSPCLPCIRINMSNFFETIIFFP